MKIVKMEASKALEKVLKEANKKNSDHEKIHQYVITGPYVLEGTATLSGLVQVFRNVAEAKTDFLVTVE